MAATCSGRRTEWLLGIGADEAAALALASLTADGFEFDWLWPLAISSATEIGMPEQGQGS